MLRVHKQVFMRHLCRYSIVYCTCVEKARLTDTGLSVLRLHNKYSCAISASTIYSQLYLCGEGKTLSTFAMTLSGLSVLDSITCTQLCKLTMTDPEPAEVIEISDDDESMLCISDLSPAATICQTPTKREPSPYHSR